ncbi:P-loop containing nucleoside triphosphate hydrolase protein [Pelagophyceae sp. CCMP2097]|nr:P-loop containing nucleoside triphosphate hydrolase protein [Pelagophyceae sp. CCMP2097]
MSDGLASLLGAAGVDDDDLVEYLRGLVEEQEWEAAQAILESSLGDEDAAAAVVEAIKALQGESVAAVEDVQLLETAAPALRFEDEQAQVDEMRAAWGKVRVTYNDIRDAADVGTSKRAERRAAKDVVRQRIALELTLEQLADDAGMAHMAVPERETAKGAGSRDVHVSNFDIHFGGTTLLRGAELHLAHGRRYGLIGPNGVGKTTLLRHMAAFDLPGFPRHLRVLHVRQEVTAASDGLRVVDAVLGADAELASLLARERRLAAALEAAEGADVVAVHAELLEVTASLQGLEADSAAARASTILNGLGFTHDMHTAPLSSLSGGWKVRCALAGALFVSPDVLMLDEPTNHLDLEAVIWLENYLNTTFKNTLVVVSHDRAFLNAVVTDCVLFVHRGLRTYKGDYDTFIRTQSEAAAQQKSDYVAYVDKRAHIQEFIDRFRCSASRAALVQSRVKLVEKMDSEAPPEPAAVTPWSFTIAAAEPLARPILQAEGLTFGYDAEKPLFSDVEIDVDEKSRVALVGANGSGKSTFLKLLLGELKPTAGEVKRKSNLRIEFFTQHHSDQLDLDLSALENLQKRFRDAGEAALRGHLGQFEVRGDLALKPCRAMSGGQKSRVAFAVLAFARPHVVVLDEPTNHLDLEAIDALAGALQRFRGGVLVVSHDQHFIQAVCSDLWVVGNSKVKKYDGDFEQYRKKTLRDKKASGALPSSSA